MQPFGEQGRRALAGSGGKFKKNNQFGKQVVLNLDPKKEHILKIPC